jgi:predicted RNase H-like HicB family nuclease
MQAISSGLFRELKFCILQSKFIYRKELSMRDFQQFTAIIEREGKQYVSLCPELDIASQGNSVEEARTNLKEALELFFETASPVEIKERWHGEVFITRLEVAVG